MVEDYMYGSHPSKWKHCLRGCLEKQDNRHGLVTITESSLESGVVSKHNW